MVMKGLGRIFMEHGSCVPQGTEVVQTGFHYTLSLIGGKYKMAILYLLAEHGVLRHTNGVSSCASV